MDPPAPASRSWSIYGRAEITQRYEVLGRVGSGAYSDVYRGRRLSDGLVVALKEIHDYQSAFREIEALQVLRGEPNVVELIEYFWQEDEDAVLVLEFLQTDLASVIQEGKKRGGVPVGEVKQWMAQILRGVEACHRSCVVHRDLKPSNLLISGEGFLKLADFGQARILQEPVSIENKPYHEAVIDSDIWVSPRPPVFHADSSHSEGSGNQIGSEPKATSHEEEYLPEVDTLKAKNPMDEIGSVHDGDASCLATCSTGDRDDDPLQGNYFYESYEGGVADDSGALTSCVGTRWFRAPELLYGSTSYGLEIDLWSLGCIFAELFRLEPLFPGTSDIDQLGRIINTLGNITEETWSGCSKLPDFGKISFNKVESPLGLETCLPNRSTAEVGMINCLISYDPANRASAAELLLNSYFNEEPLSVPLSELKIPVKSNVQEESSGEWGDYRDMESDSDGGEFSNMEISSTGKGFSIRFS